MSTSLLIATLLAAAPGLPVEVQGTSRCPEPAAVAAILPEMLPVTNELHPDIAWVETAGLDVSITLRGPDGNVRFVRTISSHGSCADLANAAAVIIATWTTERNRELSLEQPGFYPQPPVPPAPLSPPAPIATVESPAPPLPPSRRALVFEVGAGLGAALDGGGAVGCGRVDLGARGRRLGVRMTFAGDTARDQSIESGVATWRRLALGAGATLVLVEQPVLIEADAQLFAGFTTVRGRGYDANLATTDVSPGLTAGLRVGYATRWVEPWLEIGGRLWFAPQTIAVSKENQPAARVDLPRAEARVLAGLAFLLRR